MCQVFGSASVLMGPPLEWEQADPEIHVKPDLLETARDLFEERYSIDEWCAEREAFHARLKDGAGDDSH